MVWNPRSIEFSDNQIEILSFVFKIIRELEKKLRILKKVHSIVNSWNKTESWPNVTYYFDEHVRLGGNKIKLKIVKREKVWIPNAEKFIFNSIFFRWKFSISIKNTPKKGFSWKYKKSKWSKYLLTLVNLFWLFCGQLVVNFCSLWSITILYLTTAQPQIDHN